MLIKVKTLTGKEVSIIALLLFIITLFLLLSFMICHCR